MTFIGNCSNKTRLGSGKLLSNILLLSLLIGLGSVKAIADNTSTVTGEATTSPKTSSSINFISDQSYLPRVYLSGYGNDSLDNGFNGTGKLDMLQPVFLRSDKNLYIYGQGSYASKQEDWQTNSWSGTLGLGYRQLVSNQSESAGTGRIYGIYVLGDYNSSVDGHNFFDISPGLETLGYRWDLRINGYIPLTNSKWQTTYFANELGDYSHMDQSSVPHTILDTQYVYDEEAGAGGDIEFGLKLCSIKHMPLKMYLDGYYYSMSENDDMFGAGARLTFQVTPYLTLEGRYIYDNYQNSVITGGMKIFLNGLANYKQVGVDDTNIQARLFDPLERNIATLSTGTSDAVTGGPNYDSSSDDNNNIPDDDVVYKTNVWYFDSDKTTSGDGTYDNPYGTSDFNQETLESDYDPSINNGYMNLYLTGSSTYDIASVNDGDSSLVVEPKWNIYGMDSSYEKSSSVTIEGSLTLEGNNSISYVDLENDPAYSASAGITIDTDDDLASSTVNLDHVKVTYADNNSYTTGLLIQDGGETANNVVITYSDIAAKDYGIKSTNADVSIFYSNIESTVAYESNSTDNVYGIYLSDTNLQLINSNVTASVKSNASKYETTNVTGILATGTSTVTLQEGTVSASTASINSYGTVTGIGAIDYSTLNLYEGTVSAAVSQAGTQVMYGINASSHTTVKVLTPKKDTKMDIVLSGRAAAADATHIPTAFYAQGTVDFSDYTNAVASGVISSDQIFTVDASKATCAGFDIVAFYVPSNAIGINSTLAKNSSYFSITGISAGALYRVF